MKRPFVTDATLTAIAIGYRNQAQSLIADRVLPRMPVDEDFKWMFYPLEEGFNAPDARIGRRGRPNQFEFTGQERTSTVEEFGYDAPIPYSDVNRARRLREAKLSAIDPEKRAAEGLADMLLLQREVRVAGMVQNTANYDASRRLALTGTARFENYGGTSDPINVIKDGLDGTLVYRPNTVVMGQPVWSKLRSHPDLVNAVKGTESGKGMISRREFEELFEVQQLLVGESFVNLAKPGQTASLGRVWGKHIALLYVDPSPAAEKLTWGFTGEYGTKVGGRIEDEDMGLDGGFRIRVGEKVREVVCAPSVGYLIQDAVS